VGGLNWAKEKKGKKDRGLACIWGGGGVKKTGGVEESGRSGASPGVWEKKRIWGKGACLVTLRKNPFCKKGKTGKGREGCY